MATLVRWWTRDTALHSFVACQLLINVPFAAFNTYVVYQLQLVGYAVGSDDDGLSCNTYCVVPWGGTRIDLNSVLLYLNALAFGIGGAVTMFLCAYSDFWARKHWLVSFFVVCYGVLAVPGYWVQGVTVGEFQILTGLYVVFNVITLILVAVLNIYIPYCMRTRGVESVRCGDDTQSVSVDEAASAKRKYGFNMSIFGSVANSVGSTLVYVIVIILAQTLTGTAAQSSGMLVTSIAGFVTIAGSLVAIFGLPAIPAKPTSELQGKWRAPILEFFVPFKDLLVYKNLAALLVSYTIYTDSTFAVSSAIGQLFVAEIRPGRTEYSLYFLAQSLFTLVCVLGFLWMRPRLSLRLEHWLIIGYALILIIPIWACIGLSSVNFGFKERWEFYVQLLLFDLSGALVNTSFRVLFSELVPVATEVRWFGMQLVLSCATVWINYVASTPLQNATHQLRFPLIISLVFLAVALGLELCRVTLSVFKADRCKWQNIHHAANGTGPSMVQQMTTLKTPKVEAITVQK